MNEKHSEDHYLNKILWRTKIELWQVYRTKNIFNIIIKKYKKLKKLILNLQINIINLF